MTNLNQWLTRTTHGDSARTIARNIGRSHTAVSGWIRAGDMPPGVVLEIARAYHADPLEGLMAAQFLHRHDFETTHTAAKYVPTSALMDEVTKRWTVWAEHERAGNHWKPPTAWIT